MPLDTKRRAMLNVCCHIFEKLAGYLNVFEEASESSENCSCYKIVKECFDSAVCEFGKTPPDSDKTNILLNDLLDKIEGSFKLKYSSNQNILNAFQHFKNVALESSVSSLCMIEKFLEEGKKISCSCYSKFCPPEYQGAERNANLIIMPSKNTGFSSIPKKISGTSEIHFNYATAGFDFIVYINLPFYFLHEYLSHIHSANLFNENDSQQISSFEDGWLIYTAHHKYKKYIRSIPEFADNLYHKDHYLTKYISIVTNDDDKLETKRGYHLANEFIDIAGTDIFCKISFLLSATDHNSLHGYSPLHTKFIILIRKWLNRYLKMTEKDKKDQVAFLELAIEDKQPIKSLLDIIS